MDVIKACTNQFYSLLDSDTNLTCEAVSIVKIRISLTVYLPPALSKRQWHWLLQFYLCYFMEVHISDKDFLSFFGSCITIFQSIVFLIIV